MNLRVFLGKLSGVVALASAVACGSDFSPKNEVQEIRILAAKADIPYAHVGETVNLEVLAHDGRRTPNGKPMRVFWFPAPCINPPGDQYYFCYAAMQAFPERQDLTRFLTESRTTSITIPQNALDGAAVAPGQKERFITAYNFVVACAGHVERIPLKSGLGLNQIPVACFDDATGQQLDSGSFVLGFTRVFVFDTRRNAVPVLDGLTFEGQPIDPAVGIKTGVCKKDDTGQCTPVKLNAYVGDQNAEIDPDNVDNDGRQGRETIYVDWYTTHGIFRAGRKVLIDGNLGRPPKGTEAELEPPNNPVTGGRIWAILKDNRGGTVWQEFPYEVQ